MSFNIYFVIGCIIIGIFWVIVTLIRTTVNSRAKKKEMEARTKYIDNILNNVGEIYENMFDNLKKMMQ